jgi:hypothetical protein
MRPACCSKRLAAICLVDIALVHFPHMAAKETTLKEVGEMLAHVVEHMATKEVPGDLAAFPSRSQY